VVGCDFSEPMLEAARAKAAERGAATIRFEWADALDLPYETGSFDAVTVGFGVRNLADLEELESVEIVCEQRYEFDREVEARIYRIRVEPPPGNAGRVRELRSIVDSWAQDCIGERRITL
jgi:SAM-dependent methyltransferase